MLLCVSQWFTAFWSGWQVERRRKAGIHSPLFAGTECEGVGGLRGWTGEAGTWDERSRRKDGREGEEEVPRGMGNSKWLSASLCGGVYGGHVHRDRAAWWWIFEAVKLKEKEKKTQKKDGKLFVVHSCLDFLPFMAKQKLRNQIKTADLNIEVLQLMNECPPVQFLS